SELLQNGAQLHLRLNRRELLAHDLVNPRSHQHRHGVILKNNQPALYKLSGHDGIAAEQTDEAVRDHDADQQGKQRVWVMAELEQEYDAGERGAGNTSKYRCHGYQRIERRVADKARQEVPARDTIGATDAAPDD